MPTRPCMASHIVTNTYTNVHKSSFVPFPPAMTDHGEKQASFVPGADRAGSPANEHLASVSTEELPGWCDDTLRIHTSSHCGHGAQQSRLTTHNEKHATSPGPYRVYTPNHQDMSFVHAGCRTIQY